MTNSEAIELIKVAQAEVEWSCPMDYAAAFDLAIKALEQQPCEDAISRQAAINAIYGLIDESREEYKENPHIDLIVETIEDLPPVTPQPKTGRWIGIDEEPHEDWECDNCGFAIWADENIEKFHYCPNCGAKMVEPQGSEDNG